jgi:16S rRNA (adenine1518-N6/adenine1519-N6)-dimethyltransferase
MKSGAENTSIRGGEHPYRRLREHGLAARPGLGQHFLLDARILDFLVREASISPSDHVLEVGTGPGNLTRLLCERAARVVSVEIDAGMAEFARAELSSFDNLDLVVADALGGNGRLAPPLAARLLDHAPWKVVANLPYGIATPLLIELFSSGPGRIASAVVTVQKEVAERFCAVCGSAHYGPATLLLGFWARVEALRDLRPGAFSPPPKVSSTILRIEAREQPLGAVSEIEGFRAWIRALFGQRRKQIRGLLRRELGHELAAQALQSLEVSGTARAQELPAEVYLALARAFPLGAGKVDSRRERFADASAARADEGASTAGAASQERL